jgi:hypothetical protein
MHLQTTGRDPEILSTLATAGALRTLLDCEWFAT